MIIGVAKWFCSVQANRIWNAPRAPSTGGSFRMEERWENINYCAEQALKTGESGGRSENLFVWPGLVKFCFITKDAVFDNAFNF